MGTLSRQKEKLPSYFSIERLLKSRWIPRLFILQYRIPIRITDSVWLTRAIPSQNLYAVQFSKGGFSMPRMMLVKRSETIACGKELLARFSYWITGGRRWRKVGEPRMCKGFCPCCKYATECRQTLERLEEY